MATKYYFDDENIILDSDKNMNRSHYSKGDTHSKISNIDNSKCKSTGSCDLIDSNKSSIKVVDYDELYELHVGYNIYEYDNGKHIYKVCLPNGSIITEYHRKNGRYHNSNGPAKIITKVYINEKNEKNVNIVHHKEWWNNGNLVKVDKENVKPSFHKQ